MAITHRPPIIQGTPQKDIPSAGCGILVTAKFAHNRWSFRKLSHQPGRLSARWVT
jgi:hypothetical protein